MKFKKLLSSLTSTILVAFLFRVFSADILLYYQLPTPNFWLCWEAVIVLEAAGYILRGKAAYFFEED